MVAKVRPGRECPALLFHCNDNSQPAAFSFLQISSKPIFGTSNNLVITPKLEKILRIMEHTPTVVGDYMECLEVVPYNVIAKVSAKKGGGHHGLKR